VTEDGSGLADQLWDAANLRVSSHLLYPEARAALAAAARAGRLHERALRQAIADLNAAVASMQRIGVDESLAQEAGELAEKYALRGYDAVHLATLLSVADPTLVVVTWDRDLAAAALACGPSVAPALAS
jgi:predicted nucleic acid-binding protein